MQSAQSKEGSPNTRGDGLMRAMQVAHFLGVGVRTVWKLKAMGKLPAVSILGTTRFRAEDVKRLAREGVR